MARTPQNPGTDGDEAFLRDLLGSLDGRPGPARRIPSAVAAEMVRSAIEQALDVHDEDAPLPAPAPSASRWRRPLLLAAAGLLAISVGSGASAVALRLLHIELGQAELTPEPPPPPRAPRAPTPPPPEPVQELAPPPVEAPPPPAPARATRPVRRKRIVHVEAPRPPPPAPVPAPAPAPAPVVVVPENLPPADLLALANERRTRQQWRAADIYYGAVVNRFAGSDAAVVAEVASAALHLQHLGDPTGALESFHRTLRARPSGPLGEEARWGIAEAHRALGDTQAEITALRDLLEHHPDSALAPAARRRLSRIAP